MTTPAIVLTGFFLTSVRNTSVIADPGVQDRVEQVDEQIDPHHPGGAAAAQPTPMPDPIISASKGCLSIGFIVIRVTQ